MTTSLTPYLTFDGDTREAFAFYERALGAKIETMMRYADLPVSPTAGEGCIAGQTPSGDGIMHACLTLPGVTFEGVKGVMLAIAYDTIAQANSAFQALAQGGQVTMPMAPSFWAKTFGMLTDRFGISWAVNGEPIDFK